MDTKHKFTIERISKEFEKQQEFENSKKYVMLYESIKNCIKNIELPDGWLLPSTRQLSSELKLSRTTVLRAYEFLSLEKLIQSKIGSGNKVNYNNSKKPENDINKSVTYKYPELSQMGKSYFENISLINRLPNENLAFRPGLPPLDVFPINQWKKLLNIYWRYINTSHLSYSESSGLTELKKSVANYLNISRNLKCDFEQIVIVSGSLQSLFLIATTLINKGDNVVVENPLFPNAHSVFKSSKANLIPLPLDNEGIQINNLKIKNHKKIKLIHVTPSNHYPLGIKMSLKRRVELLNWASKNGSLIIENDYENEIANCSEATPTIFSLDNEDRTIYLGTFNRLLHPSIRLGYMIVPKHLLNGVKALVEHSHRFVTPSIQIVMNQFIEKNYLYQHIKNCITAAKERHELFVNQFTEKIKSMQLLDKSFNSLHLVAKFNNIKTPKEEFEIIAKLKARNITAFSLSKCYIGTPEKTGLIFGYSAVRKNFLIKKIDIMSKVI